MKMLGIFCNSSAVTNEELKKDLKRKAGMYMLVFLICAAAIIIGAVYSHNGGSFFAGADMEYYYYGLMTGLMVGCAIAAARNLFIMRSEEKLTELRILQTDERNIAINMSAVKASVGVFFLATLLMLTLSCFMVLETAKILMFLMILFLFSYTVAYKLYSMRM